MLELAQYKNENVVEITVLGELEKLDFQTVRPKVDEVIDEQGELSGLLLNISMFEGWHSVSALMEHLKFVGQHRNDIRRVAAVGSTKWHEYLPKLGSLFTNADARYFDILDIEAARTWVRTKES